MSLRIFNYFLEVMWCEKMGVFEKATGGNLNDAVYVTVTIVVFGLPLCLQNADWSNLCPVHLLSLNFRQITTICPDFHQLNMIDVI